MGIPPADKIQELAQIIKTSSPTPAQEFGDVDAVKDWLKKHLKLVGTTAAQSAIQTGVTMAAGVPTLTIGVGVASIALMPLGAALAPWLGALAIGYKATGIFALHDLKSDRSGAPGRLYPCSCKNCTKGLRYVVDKKENNTAIVAVSIFTVGLPFIADRINSIRKSFQPNRPKEQISRQFVDGARAGCSKAIAAIMLMCGEWKHQDKPDRELVLEALAIIVGAGGWKRLKTKW